MLALLLSSGVIDLALGDLRRALILMVFALASIVITVASETRTEPALEALRDPASPRALVAAAAGLQRKGRQTTLPHWQASPSSLNSYYPKLAVLGDRGVTATLRPDCKFPHDRWSQTDDRTSSRTVGEQGKTVIDAMHAFPEPEELDGLPSSALGVNMNASGEEAILATAESLIRLGLISTPD